MFANLLLDMGSILCYKLNSDIIWGLEVIFLTDLHSVQEQHYSNLFHVTVEGFGTTFWQHYWYYYTGLCKSGNVPFPAAGVLLHFSCGQ